MTTDMPTLVSAIRMILQDNPNEDYTTGAIANTSVTTTTVNDITQWGKGQVWEFDDGATSAEQVLVRSVDTATSTPTLKRGHRSSTAATHASGVVVLKEPRFRYDLVAQAVNAALDTNLFSEGVYNVVQHQVTSSATTQSYNAPSTSCEEFLWVYQRIAATDDPLQIRNFDRLGRKVDPALWANGKVFGIRQNYGVAGTDVYYIDCKHAYDVTSLDNIRQAPVQIVKWYACAYLLEWSEPRRTAGPTNQGDQTVRAGTGVGTAQYYRLLAARAAAKERAYLKGLTPPYRTFRKN